MKNRSVIAFLTLTSLVVSEPVTSFASDVQPQLIQEVNEVSGEKSDNTATDPVVSAEETETAVQDAASETEVPSEATETSQAEDTGTMLLADGNFVIDGTTLMSYTVTGYSYSEVPFYCEKYDNLTFVALEQHEEEKFTIDERHRGTNPRKGR